MEVTLRQIHQGTLSARDLGGVKWTYPPSIIRYLLDTGVDA